MVECLDISQIKEDLGAVPEHLANALEDLLLPPNLRGVHHRLVIERIRLWHVCLHQVHEAVPGLGLAEGDGDLAEVTLLPVAKPPVLHDLLARDVLQGLAVDVTVEHHERSGFRANLRGGPREVHDSLAVHERVADIPRPAVEALGDADGVRLLRERRGLVGPRFPLLLGVALDVSALLVPEILAG